MQMENKARENSHLLLGSPGITSELKKAGYAWTICATIATEDGTVRFQDLHVTTEQLRSFCSIALRSIDAEEAIR
jgi:ribonucleotide monophosphatase NagD (HAD superfamily)